MAATNVSPSDSPSVVITGSFTLDPASVAAGGTGTETAAVPEAKVGDCVIVNPRGGLTDGLIIGHVRVSAAGTIEITLENHTGSPIDQGSGTWNYALIRGASGPGSLG